MSESTFNIIMGLIAGVMVISGLYFQITFDDFSRPSKQAKIAGIMMILSIVALITIAYINLLQLN